VAKGLPPWIIEPPNKGVAVTIIALSAAFILLM
jgi:hypothetical protein